MYLHKTDGKTFVAGPYWRSLIRVYDIQVGDVVLFTYVGKDADFDPEMDEDFALTVFQIGENGREVKLPVGFPGKIAKSATQSVKTM